jgi:hypothetical protein
VRLRRISGVWPMERELSANQRGIGRLPKLTYNL